MKKLAVFGGTFNPFHNGHEQMLQAICNRDEVDKVLIIPDKIPPHKSLDYLASDFDRLSMCRLAGENFEKAEVSDIELKREGKSYTIETLKALKTIYPDYRLAICIGGDMVTSFTEWKDYSEILKLAELYVFSRKGNSTEDFENALKLLSDMGAVIFVLNDEIFEISSTEIRNAIKSRQSVCDLLPKSVYDYIQKNKVY